MEIDTPVVNSCTGLFNMVVCGFCRKIPIQHRCLDSVVDGGLPHNGDMVCGPCSYIFGNEGKVRCKKHTVNNSNSEDDETIIE
jgi:hypothetical protein